jgi:hypothetical protein
VQRGLLICLASIAALLLTGANARAQFTTSINVSPPHWIFERPKRDFLWRHFFTLRTPWSQRDDDFSDLSPPERDPFEYLDIWRYGWFVYNRPASVRHDGMIDMSPRRRPWYERMSDHWPYGALIPRDPARAPKDGISDVSPPQPTFMYAAGVEGWPAGAFAHGALLWSPMGLYNEGFVVKALFGGGTYRYRAGALGNAEVQAMQSVTSIMPGARVKMRGFEATVYLGLDIQDHVLNRFDPDNRLRGVHRGLRGGADLWYEPVKGAMLAANLQMSTIATSYSARLAGGVWLYDTAWVGPEVQALAGPYYRQRRVCGHVTALAFAELEWSAGIGYAFDTDRRNGVYGRFSLLARR